MAYREGHGFVELGRLASSVDRAEAGLRLLAAWYVIDLQMGHPDADEKDLPAVRQLAEARGYDEEQVQALIAEVEAAYRQDRGRGVVLAAFPELADDEQEAG